MVITFICYEFNCHIKYKGEINNKTNTKRKGTEKEPWVLIIKTNKLIWMEWPV